MPGTLEKLSAKFTAAAEVFGLFRRLSVIRWKLGLADQVEAYAAGKDGLRGRFDELARVLNKSGI